MRTRFDHAMKKNHFLSVLLLLSISSTLLSTACLRRKAQENTTAQPEATLTFYGLFDNEDVYTPFISAYETAHPNVTILYKKFTDPNDYLDLIVNELAEGEGPDIFMLHNTWLPKHYKKLTAAPSELLSPELFRSSFVDVTANDLIIPDTNNVEQVWGLPMYVDTLALYYNDAHFEDAIPSQGAPSSTWDGIKNDVTLLNRQDQSFERFERAGIALGRSDNILRAFDVLMMMMLDYKVNFYSDDLTTVNFDTDPNALKALDLYTSFGLPSKKNYSWNKYLSDADSSEKEITTFAKGKLSMLFGYSYTYEDILSEINRLQQEGEETISVSDVKIQEAPQAFDPSTSAETRKTYASYFVPVVSRTSQNADIAWDFLLSMTDTALLKDYNNVTHRPSALRSLITEEMKDPTYGVFAGQVGYAESIPMSDPTAFKDYFLDAVDSILSTAQTQDVLQTLAEEIQTLIPSSGIKPIYVPSTE